MQGYIVYFNEEKGYGFIGSDDYEENIFVHISDIQGAKELTQGQKVTFQVKNTPKGLNAIQVIPGMKQQSPYLIFAVISLIFGASIFFYASQYMESIIAYLLAINIMTFVLYGYDKYISKGERLRVPEVNLQTLALLGGSPSALFAQKFFRHKTLKGSFQIIYWLIVLGQVGLIFWLM